MAVIDKKKKKIILEGIEKGINGFNEVVEEAIKETKETIEEAKKVCIGISEKLIKKENVEAVADRLIGLLKKTEEALSRHSSANSKKLILERMKNLIDKMEKIEKSSRLSREVRSMKVVWESLSKKIEAESIDDTVADSILSSLEKFNGKIDRMLKKIAEKNNC